MPYKEKIQEAFETIWEHTWGTEETNREIDRAFETIETSLLCNRKLQKAYYHIELLNEFIAIGGMMMDRDSDYSQALREHFGLEINTGRYEDGELKFVKAILEFIDNMERENDI